MDECNSSVKENHLIEFNNKLNFVKFTPIMEKNRQEVMSNHFYNTNTMSSKSENEVLQWLTILLKVTYKEVQEMIS